MNFYVVQEWAWPLFDSSWCCHNKLSDCLSEEADYQRKRNREDDRQPRESSKRTSDPESRRNFDPDSRPVIFKCIIVLCTCEHSLNWQHVATVYQPCMLRGLCFHTRQGRSDFQPVFIWFWLMALMGIKNTEFSHAHCFLMLLKLLLFCCIILCCLMWQEKNPRFRESANSDDEEEDDRQQRP